MPIYLFVVHIKDLLKFPLICDIAVIIPFNYPTYNITVFLLINACLAKDLFKELEVGF